MIRKLLAAAGAIAAVVFLTLMAMAGTAAAADVSQFCTANGDFGVSHGGCVAAFTNGNLTPAIADFCRDPQVQAAVDAKNHGACVNTLKDLFSNAA